MQQMKPFIDDMRDRNTRDMKLLEELDHELIGNRSIAPILAKLEQEDMDSEKMIEHFRLECTTQAERLRHRATMLRAKAAEMDNMADNISGSILDTTIKVIEATSRSLVDIEQTLHDHRHIEPTRES